MDYSQVVLIVLLCFQPLLLNILDSKMMTAFEKCQCNGHTVQKKAKQVLLETIDTLTSK